MAHYQAPLGEIAFALRLVGADTLCTLPGYAEATPDLLESIIAEAARFAEQELLPLNASGDAEGCHFADGNVRTPAGFVAAYRQFREAGWTSLSGAPDYGGQGLPNLLNFVVDEIICSANLSFGIYPGLSHGAYHAIDLHGSVAQKALYLPRLVSGEWSGTMNLTEPQAGTDLGLLRTRAEPGQDDSWRITGTKIFISAGEHDLTENIVHLVLARLPDAPAGVKGISLFVVPKFLPNADGTLGARNAVHCGRIEHKMGIKGSATCVMNYEGATGWLVGAPHAGLRAMFTMMNDARLMVGMQGLGIAEVAYQNAVAYARDRLQGRSLAGAQFPDKPADPLLVHPDVRRMLLSIRAVLLPARVLAYRAGLLIDVAQRHPDPARRQEAEDFVALLIPVIKSFLTDFGSEAANTAMQIYGGHGYIRDHGIEQFVRDARIAPIYEGANGIQALDLVGRKLPEATGRLLRRFFHPTAALIEEAQANPLLADAGGALAKNFGRLQQATVLIAQRGLSRPLEAGAASHDYLRLFGLVALGAEWLRILGASLPQAGDSDPAAKAHAARAKTAHFFFSRILPQAGAHFAAIQAGAAPLLALSDEEF